MITIDNRQGSKDLHPLFPKGMAELGHLQYGDLAFLGRGPGDTPLAIGVERKRIRDLVDSLASGRLSGHQLPGLCNCYDIVYLVIEGLWRPHPETGLLETYSHGEWLPLTLGSRGFMAREIYNFINSLTIFAGVLSWVTANPRETMTLTTSLWHWWNDKGFYSHVSYRKAHRPFVNIGVMQQKSLVFKMAMEIPGVGPERAVDVAKRFPTVMDMVLAGTEEWRSIPGFGEVLGERIPKLLQEYRRSKGTGNEKSE